MKLKELRSALQEVSAFERAKIEFEQYPTSADLASHMVFTMQSNYESVEGKRIADLGCGCGMLSIACCLMGGRVVGFDIDPDALEIARRNSEQLELLDAVDWLQCDVRNLPLRGLANLAHETTTETTTRDSRGRRRFLFDTVVMNPPFGTKTTVGIDMMFVEQALKVPPNWHTRPRRGSSLANDTHRRCCCC